MTQLFFSHTWHNDNLGRNTHERVINIAKNLKLKGWNIWIDEENMKNNIDAAMADGIEKSDVVLIFLTEMYIKKVNNTAKDPRLRDNCLKEWTYANALNKLIIPIVFEPILLNVTNWPTGIIQLYLGSTLYIDCINNNSELCANQIHDYLIKLQLKPKIESKIESKLKFNLKRNNSFFQSKNKKVLISKSFNSFSKNFKSFKNNYFKSFLKKEKTITDINSSISSDLNTYNQFYTSKSIITLRVPPRIAPILKK